MRRPPIPIRCQEAGSVPLPWANPEAEWVIETEESCRDSTTD